MRANQIPAQVIFGFIVVVIGVLLLLETTDVAGTVEVVRWIPSVFIVIGVWRLVSSGFQHVAGPLIIITVAGIVQLALIDVDIWSYWPVVLIIIGLSILLGRYRLSRRRARERYESSSSEVSGVAAFSGVNRRVSSDAFTGGDITVVLGSYELDLMDARVEDRPAVLEATVILGSAEIRVPPDWVVQNDSAVMLGEFNDKRRQTTIQVSGKPDLVINGMVLLGSLTLKD